MRKKLFLFTSSFPFGNGETFLETEINHLSEAFDEVVIISNDLTSSNLRGVPENCTLLRRSYEIGSVDKLKALKGVLSSNFWKELKIIKNVYGKSKTKGIINTVLVSLYRGKQVKRYCEGLMQKDTNEYQHYFYSYWCNDTALGLAMLSKEQKDVKCFSRIHGWDVYFEVSEVGYLPFRHFIAENLKTIFSISQKGKDYCRDIWKISNPEKVQVSRLGVKSQKAPDNSPNGNNLIVVSCSNLIPLKRVELIVQALSQITDIPIKWIHYGNGPLFNTIESLAKEVLPKNISWELKGHISNSELMEWYSNNYVDLFINVSSSEGVPVSIMEAMSFGIPVLATNVGGTGEIVSNDNGRLISSNPEPSEVVSAITDLARIIGQETALLRDAAFSTWKTKYNAEMNYTNFVNSLLELGA